ncbi:MAG: 1-(5-phosphoribosyl)-5-[(5-phosphoribosylamino)methylideneamino]imidazole-4-carboxamide isomerase [Gemmatimonadales bacterium]|nr:1-(5-phosphoribosyl)-5-[(5-phosphoribosylamino)methylideneamino]imidazole-4-carboxamide isomerase [Gemmatimonadales bacterium]
MDLLPSIDIRNGRVVRLSQGERSRQTVYGEDPVAVAERFVAEGARWIHVVDLDRAFGTGDNMATVRRVAEGVASRLRLQLGGGLRSMELVREALDLGFARAVIGTAAATDPSFLHQALMAVRAEQLAVAIDARDGMVALRGWTETSTMRADELARSVVKAGVKTLIYTDISRDGMLTGPDLAGAVALRATGGSVIVSGGIAGADDIRAACQAGVQGVIVGRALYVGRLSVPEAIQAAACSSSS